MQISIRRQHAQGFDGSIRDSLGPRNAVPEYFQVGMDADFLWRTGTENICQIEYNSFLTSRGESKIVLRNNPATFSIRDFKAHSLRLPAVPLCDCNVDG